MNPKTDLVLLSNTSEKNSMSFTFHLLQTHSTQNPYMTVPVRVPIPIVDTQLNIYPRGWLTNCNLLFLWFCLETDYLSLYNLFPSPSPTTVLHCSLRYFLGDLDNCWSYNHWNRFTRDTSTPSVKDDSTPHLPSVTSSQRPYLWRRSSKQKESERIPKVFDDRIW